jgi:hypothetical protein
MANYLVLYSNRLNFLDNDNIVGIVVANSRKAALKKAVEVTGDCGICVSTCNSLTEGELSAIEIIAIVD